MTRIRRIRRAAAALDEARLDALMQSIANLQDSIRAMKVQLDGETAELLSLMRASKLTTHRAGGVLAELKQSKGRASSYIDPRKFQKLVPEDDFFAAIEVRITAARKLVTERTLSKVLETTPGTPGPYSVSVTRVENG